MCSYLTKGHPFILRLEYDEDLSNYRGRPLYYSRDLNRYYTKIDGEWMICTNNYYLEPDVHLNDNVKVIIKK